jgi:hypothetical protein
MEDLLVYLVYFLKAAKLEAAAAFDEMCFGGVGFAVDKGDDDDGGEVDEFSGDVEGFGSEDELGPDSLGKGCECEESLGEHAQKFVSVEHR